MKDMINERLILLATAQERMADMADKLEHWEGSLSYMEKCSFEAINTSDKVLNMSKEGRQLVEHLLETSLNSCCALDADEKFKLAAKLEELKKLFHNIMEASAENNDVSHKIETETECQKEIIGNIKKSLGTICESIDSAAACAEFILAEM